MSLDNLTYFFNEHALPYLLGFFSTLTFTIKNVFSSFLVAFVGINSLTVHQRCPGYRVSNLQQTINGLTADLQLAGAACNVYGYDLPNLTLRVDYQTDTRLHVIIEDQDQTVYQVPEFILPRPSSSSAETEVDSQLVFDFVEDPFSFTVSRAGGEILFDTSSFPIIFESQYLNIRTKLPTQPNIYGLGEHSDSFRLNTTNYTKTVWARDAGGIPSGTNLYGAHPIYLEHRGEKGTHGVVLVSSNGMDIKIDDDNGQYLEYNILGGVFDFYFVAGPSPIDVAQQISEVVGTPAMVPYSGLGYHNCRYGYQDIWEVAEVIHNYSAAGIPLETMWIDIDYMDSRQVFSLDPDRFPLDKVREVVDYLHAHQQSFVLMVDPAVGMASEAYTTGHRKGAFIKTANGSDFKGVVWPGVAAFPDWFAPNTQEYWTGQFAEFFNSATGVDIDYLWIDMNEPANFCYYPCADPEGFARSSGNPPAPPPVRDGPAVQLPEFPPDFTLKSIQKRQSQVLYPMPDSQDQLLEAGADPQTPNQIHQPRSKIGLPERELTDPPYAINNAIGTLSNFSLNTSLIHHGGYAEYDTHNLFGTMMSNASRQAMLARRPGTRPLIITRSTFLGAGSYVGHWLGDNRSEWRHYRITIAQMLQFASIFQIPMVGSDVCGFDGSTTETLCARWMLLGAFNPFFRNHNAFTTDSIPQEAYRWPIVAAAARNAIDIRYRLLDYLYTGIWKQTQDGSPVLNPLFYLYPHDKNTFGIEHQFFYGNALLVSPVTQEDSNTVDIYLPDDIFYDWNQGFVPIRGRGCNVTINDVGFETIPIHVRGGSIVPMRLHSANTTTELRSQPFRIVIAPDLNGTASGCLYLDEGSLINQPATTTINMTYNDDKFSMTGFYRYPTSVRIEAIDVLGVLDRPAKVSMGDKDDIYFTYNFTSKVLRIIHTLPLTEDATLRIRRSPIGHENEVLVNSTGKTAGLNEAGQAWVM